ncbi:MAG TPA: ABC transporter permease [Chthoniobacterales bacterium]|nr:ABC transporter permease [Chthoniobacterales bacterium]
MITDLKYALRMLLKTPGFTLIVIATLALGIGANSAIFSVVNAVLLQPLPLSEPGRLVQLYESKQFPAGFLGSSSAANVQDWREQNTVLEGVAAYHYQDFALQDRQNPERIIGVMVSAEYFRLLGARPLLGRTLLEGEDKTGAGAVVVLSEGLWRTRFASDPAMVGRAISLDGRAYTVIGIMPDGFRFPSPRCQVWVPLVISPAELATRGDHGLQVIGRLRPGISLAQAQANMKVVAQGIAQKFPGEQGDRSVQLIPLQENLTRHSRTSLLVLLGSVACVLLIASANIASLLLARTAGRQREVALRLALGASRARLVRQFLTESILLALLGGAAGIVTAIWGTDLLVALLGDRIPGSNTVALDGTVLAFTAVIAVLVGIGCGLAPARQAVGPSAADLQTALHGHSAVAGANRLRGLFVVAEMALAVVLLTGAGLLLRSFAQLQRTDSGLRQPEQVLTARVALPNERYAKGAAVVDFYRRALERVEALPGVRSAGAINFLPLAQWGMNGNVELEGHPFPPGRAPLSEFRAVAGNYFATMGVALLAGRLVDARDGAGAPPVIVVNRAFARRFGQSETEILGGTVKLAGTFAFNIVGVVADVRQAGLDRAPEPEMYFSVAQAPGSEGLGGNMLQSSTLVVRADAADPSALAESVRRAVREIDPTLPLFRVETLRSVIAESVADRRLNGALLGTFAAIALGLAALGLYGVVSYTVTQRTRELGIRLALGAQRGDLFRLVVGGGMKLAAMGLAVGLVAAFALTRLLESLLYGVGASDPLTFGIVVVVLGAVAFLANYLPACRAARVNPMVALRYE